MRNPGPQVAGGLSLLNKFLVKSALLTYTFVKNRSFVRSNTEFCDYILPGTERNDGGRT